MARGQKPAQTKQAKKRGRPSAFKQEFVEQARKLALLGLTDDEMADVFGVAVRTFQDWKKRHPDFLHSIKKGKVIADAEVGASLYERACGYSHPDAHISSYEGEITVTPITKHYPPDTAAAFIWLKNRQPKKWRDRRDAADSDDEMPESKAFVFNVVDGKAAG